MSRALVRRGRAAALVAIGVLAAGAAHAAGPRWSVEYGQAYTSFEPVESGAPYENHARWMPRVAVAATFATPKGFRWTTELQYGMRGETRDVERLQFQQHQTLRERSVALGLWWSHDLLPGLAFEAGPQISYLLDADTWGEQTTGSGTIQFSQSYESTPVDVLFMLGLVGDLPIGRHAIFAQARFVQGITVQNREATLFDPNDRNQPWTSSEIPLTTTTARTRAMELGVGLRW